MTLNGGSTSGQDQRIWRCHTPALDDVTPPEGRRFALGALALVLLVLILLPVSAAVRMMNLDSPYQ